MKKLHRAFAVFAATAFLTTVSGFALAATEEKTQNNIQYVTGGIGEQETLDIRSNRSKYSLHISNAGKNGSFEGSAHYTIIDSQGNELVDTDGGPLLYANLPEGKYSLIIKSAKRTQIKTFSVQNGKPVTLRIIW